MLQVQVLPGIPIKQTKGKYIMATSIEFNSILSDSRKIPKILGRAVDGDIGACRSIVHRCNRIEQRTRKLRSKHQNLVVEKVVEKPYNSWSNYEINHQLMDYNNDKVKLTVSPTEGQIRVKYNPDKVNEGTINHLVEKLMELPYPPPVTLRGKSRISKYDYIQLRSESKEIKAIVFYKEKVNAENGNDQTD